MLADQLGKSLGHITECVAFPSEPRPFAAAEHGGSFGGVPPVT
jgi:hypothetical protein